MINLDLQGPWIIFFWQECPKITSQGKLSDSICWSISSRMVPWFILLYQEIQKVVTYCLKGLENIECKSLQKVREL